MASRSLLVAVVVLVAPFAARAAAQCEVAQLVAPVVDPDSFFAQDLALQGSVAVIGEGNEVFGSSPSWVFELQSGGWTAGSPLPPAQMVTSYGDSVAVWGDTAVVAGQELFDMNVAATVFERVAGSWVQSAQLHEPTGSSEPNTGLRVAIEGDTIVVADRLVGAAFVFERVAGSWSLSQTLVATGTSSPFSFGQSVSLRDGRAVIGGCAPYVGNDCFGTAWVFERQGGPFVQVAQLMTSGGEAGDYAGWDVAQSGDTIVLGAPGIGLGSHVTGIGAPGAAFVFERVGGAWVQTAFVTAPGPQVGDAFGVAVALQDDLLLIGAPYRDGLFPQAGAVFVYRRVGSAWQHVVQVQAEEQLFNGYFGSSLAVDGDRLLVAAGGEERVHVLRGVQGLTDWLPVGGGVAGNGAPCTFGSGPPTVGAPATLTLVGALPKKPGWLVLGIDRINAPFKGGVLVPAPQLLVPLLTDATGGKTFGWTWPPALPPGLVLALQHWIVDAGAPFGLAGADALIVDVP